MMTLPMMLQRMAGDLTPVCCPQGEFLPIQKISILSSGDPADDPGTLYIGERKIIKTVLANRKDFEGQMFIVAEEAVYLKPPIERQHLCLLRSPLSISQLSNRLMEELFQFNHWLDTLRDIVYRRGGVKGLLQTISQRSGYPIFWMNSGYHLLAADVNYSFEDRYIQKLLMNGYMNSSDAELLLSYGQRLPLSIRERANAYISVLETGHCYILCEIWDRNRFLGQFLMIAEEEDEARILADYARIAASFLWQYCSMERGQEFPVDNSYSDLLIDLIDERIQGEAELTSRCARLSPPMTSYYQVAIVTFEEGKELPYSSLMKALGDFLPDSEIVRYNKEIILFQRLKNPASKDWDTAQLCQLLQQYGAFLSIGGSSQFLSSFRSIYHQAQSCLRLGIVLRENPEQRFFVVGDYHLYVMIDLCAEQMEARHEKSLIYLCSQQYTALCRYDQEHDSNLCEILDTYIRNNCNTSQTAKVLYLHRNTLINKVNRIQEIVGGNLEDLSLRNQLYFSSLVMHYLRQYRKINPFPRLPHPEDRK